MTSMPDTAMPTTAHAGRPFDPDADADYAAWRERKLDGYPVDAGALMVNIGEATRLSARELGAIRQRVAKAGLALYQLEAGAEQSKPAIRQLGRQLGLERLDSNLCADEDSITSLQVVEKRREGEYIPYTNKRLNWHTDGYYNTLANQVRGVILHCVRPARSGGENAFLDHEIAYMVLRDENPDFIRALMQPDAMTIPPNVQAGREIRGEQSGPVFSVDVRGRLHMRYSARARNIVWRDDALTQAAAQALLNLFQSDSPYIFRHRLEAGQGVISNNALHCRNAFDPAEGGDRGRLLYRARYYDRVADAG